MKTKEKKTKPKKEKQNREWKKSISYKRRKMVKVTKVTFAHEYTYCLAVSRIIAAKMAQNGFHATQPTFQFSGPIVSERPLLYCNSLKSTVAYGFKITTKIILTPQNKANKYKSQEEKKHKESKWTNCRETLTSAIFRYRLFWPGFICTVCKVDVDDNLCSLFVDKRLKARLMGLKLWRCWRMKSICLQYLY